MQNNLPEYYENQILLPKLSGKVASILESQQTLRQTQALLWALCSKKKVFVTNLTLVCMRARKPLATTISHLHSGSPLPSPLVALASSTASRASLTACNVLCSVANGWRHGGSLPFLPWNGPFRWAGSTEQLSLQNSARQLECQNPPQKKHGNTAIWKVNQCMIGKKIFGECLVETNKQTNIRTLICGLWFLSYQNRSMAVVPILSLQVPL